MEDNNQQQRAFEALSEMRGFPLVKHSNTVSVGEVFNLKGIGKAKIVMGKRGLTVQKQN